MNINEIAAAKSNFVARAVDEELVLVPLRNNVADMTEIFNLNEVGHFIWNEIQEGATVKSLTEKIVSEYEVETAVAQSDLEEFLKDLSNFILND
ncbi:MAG: hypothetical protein RLZZ155_43 [Bacteroidota bacterium]